MSGQEPATLDVGFRAIDGVRVRYTAGGQPAASTILLTSPWPESVHAFAPIWPVLATRFRLVALDLPGFGMSDHSDRFVTPTAMGGFLARVIEDLGLGRPHLVGPDVGTSAALFAAATRPDLVSSVIVGSGGAAVPIELGGALADWVLAPDVDRFRAMDPAAIVGAALGTIHGYEIPAAIREDYLASYQGERFVDSMRYVRTYPDELPKLAELLPRTETPVLIIAGEHDRAVPLVNAQFLDDRLPDSSVVVVDAGHFVWEEAAAQYASLVGNWVGGGYLGATAVSSATRLRSAISGGHRG